MNTQKLTLDLSKRPMQAKAVEIAIGDKSGVLIECEITNNGEQVDLHGVTASLVISKPGERDYFATPGNVRWDVGIIEFDVILTDMKPGRANGYVIIAGGDFKVSTNRVQVNILKGA